MIIHFTCGTETEILLKITGTHVHYVSGNSSDCYYIQLTEIWQVIYSVSNCTILDDCE